MLLAIFGGLEDIGEMVAEDAKVKTSAADSKENCFKKSFVFFVKLPCGNDLRLKHDSLL